MARDVLDHRHHAAGEQPLRLRPRHLGDAAGLGGKRAVADHLVRPWRGHVRHRRAIDVDPERHEVVGDQPRTEPRVVWRGVRLSRRIAPPLRWSQPLHPTAFLIDQDGSVGPADGVAKIVHQPTHLVRALDVASE